MNLAQLENQISKEFGGPAIGAWPTRPGQRLRPHKGGGGDGGARQMEEERQARQAAAIAEINRIFNGGPSKRGVGATTAISRSGKYYDEYGNPVDVSKFDDKFLTPETTFPNTFASALNPELLRIRSMLQNGGLYTGVQETSGTGGREQMYSSHRDAVYDLNKQDAERQFEDATRQTKFGLARSGLAGGSVDIDDNAELIRRRNEGLMRATGIADEAAANLKLADERTRANLVATAQSGIDVGTAAQMAAKGLEANATSAAGDRAGATVGSLFGDLSRAYLNNQVMQGYRAGMQNNNGQWFGVSSPQQRYQGT
jgi:hypothetical protein